MLLGVCHQFGSHKLTKALKKERKKQNKEKKEKEREKEEREGEEGPTRCGRGPARSAARRGPRPPHCRSLGTALLIGRLGG